MAAPGEAFAQLPFFRTSPTPPGQPEEGPGSADYPHAAVRVTLHSTGSDSYWLYAPASPLPDTAPLLIYLRGYGDLDPAYYDALFTHLARKGFLVAFPSYGHPFFDLFRFESIALRSVAATLAALQDGEAPRPNGDLALGGFSMGALLALRVAARTDEVGIPDPDLLVLHEPAGVAMLSYPLAPIDLASIAPGTRMLVIQAEASIGDPNAFAEEAFVNTVSIPRTQKNLLRVHSDRHGFPRLVSNHLGVHSGGFGRPLDAIDFWGYFRPTEAALQEAFDRSGGWELREAEAVEADTPDSVFCCGAGPECEAVRYAGEWSDGTPVEPHQNAGDLGL